mmetsp:Transcript_20206/g.20586  ORF Transcript_20206/g.20586 Transcript_20206/m.20586 type:complete len:91 (-) Transcript_20206:657-929(-)
MTILYALVSRQQTVLAENTNDSGTLSMYDNFRNLVFFPRSFVRVENILLQFFVHVQFERHIGADSFSPYQALTTDSVASIHAVHDTGSFV